MRPIVGTTLFCMFVTSSRQRRRFRGHFLFHLPELIWSNGQLDLMWLCPDGRFVSKLEFESENYKKYPSKDVPNQIQIVHQNSLI